jgi:hypothetical protein
MTRNGRVARCALLSSPDRLEVHVTLDEEVLLVRSGATKYELLALAGHWKTRMADDGWTIG